MVVASTVETETGVFFLNTKEGVNIREMGHPQPLAPMQTDSMTMHGILCRTCKQHHSKSIDMLCYWVHTHVQQGKSYIGWGPSAHNLRDYFTKHHTPDHRKGIISMYLRSDNSPRYIPTAHKKPLQGCVDSALSPGTPTGYHTNSAMTGKPCTSTYCMCLLWTIFRAMHSASLRSLKFS
jgi:hypothetical protein